MKLSDYVVEFLFQNNVHHVFGVTGGAVVHLFDSVSKHPHMEAIFTHHEQAAAFAAQAYSRMNDKLGCCIVTTGPGGTNAITGLSAAWLDSIPTIYISGQTRHSHTSRGTPLRQVGTQELDIISIVASITKYSVMLEDPSEVRYELEKALYIAKSGRPGPVWIDIPLDMQWATVIHESLKSFSPPALSPINLKNEIKDVLIALRTSQRPLILLGHGVRLAKAEEEFKELLNLLNIPFISTWNISDLFPSDHSRYIGRPGIFGQRGANLAMQNCDFLLCLGSHLCISLTGTLFKAFAREAKIAVINIDKDVLENSTISPDYSINIDVKKFLKSAIKLLKKSSGFSKQSPYLEKCQEYKNKYNGISKNKNDYGMQKSDNQINPYEFLDCLSDYLQENDIIVVDGGGTVVQMAFQALRLKKNQRLIIDAALCSMGSGLPQSIGAFWGTKDPRSVICLCGDGSFQFNIHELQTVFHHQIPLKLFVFNNQGYLSIRHTQGFFLDSNFIGSSPREGISFPSITKLAKAYEIPAVKIENNLELPKCLSEILITPGPTVCEVMIPNKFIVAPKQGFKKIKDKFIPTPLENMAPFLDEKEMQNNLFVKPWSFE